MVGRSCELGDPEDVGRSPRRPDRPGLLCSKGPRGLSFLRFRINCSLQAPRGPVKGPAGRKWTGNLQPPARFSLHHRRHVPGRWGQSVQDKGRPSAHGSARGGVCRGRPGRGRAGTSGTPAGRVGRARAPNRVSGDRGGAAAPCGASPGPARTAPRLRAPRAGEDGEGVGTPAPPRASARAPVPACGARAPAPPAAQAPRPQPGRSRLLGLAARRRCGRTHPLSPPAP